MPLADSLEEVLSLEADSPGPPTPLPSPGQSFLPSSSSSEETRLCHRTPRLRPMQNQNFSLPHHEKWSLKNTPKWMDTPVGGAPAHPSHIIPTKSFKEDDSHHSPSHFLEAHPEIDLVIDLSSSPPSYDTTRLNQCTVDEDCCLHPEDEGSPFCKYAKLPGVSKKVPSREDVRRFCNVVNNFLRDNPGSYVAVHCHYGFNRTGFMVCAYLVEEMGVEVESAIDIFAEIRSPGIKHEWFKDELKERYSKMPRVSSSLAFDHIESSSEEETTNGTEQ